MRYNNYVIFLDQQEHGERFVKVPSACMLSACENGAYESVPLSRHILLIDSALSQPLHHKMHQQASRLRRPSPPECA